MGAGAQTRQSAEAHRRAAGCVDVRRTLPVERELVGAAGRSRLLSIDGSHRRPHARLSRSLRRTLVSPGGVRLKPSCARHTVELKLDRYNIKMYAELHAHSNFTLLDGGSHPEELIDRAKALGLAGIAITDRDGLYGAVRFAQSGREMDLPAIIGAELTLEDQSHLVVLVESKDG